ncbi:hypothetical protein VTO73DRAFT_13016 [Trametes versicolor]
MSCVTSPTATQFTTFTTDSVSTSFSDSVSTLDPTVTTIQSVSCVPTSNGTLSASSCSTVDSVSTIAGGTTTIQVPVFITVPITSSSATATLFTTSCTSDSSSPTDTSSAPTSTTTVVLTTAVETTVTFQSSFTSDGTVIFTSGTSTAFSTVLETQTSVLVPTGTSSSSGSSDTSAIVGGAVGGVVGAIILALFVWLLFRKKRRYDFDDELFLHEAVNDDHSKHVLRKNGGEKQGVDVDADPRPYTYGALSAGPSSGPQTPSTEGPPPVPYRGPPPPPRPAQFYSVPGKGLPPSPRPVPSQTSLSTPSAYSTHPSAQSYSGLPAANASVSTLTTTGAGGYDQHRPLQVVNNYAPVQPQPVGLPSPSEKSQIYLHPDRGLTTVTERSEPSGSSMYVPRRPPTPAGLASVPGPLPPPQAALVSQPDPSRGPFVHQDAGRAAPARAPESEAPPAYSV